MPLQNRFRPAHRARRPPSGSGPPDLARGNYSSNLYQTLTDPVVETCTLRLYADATPVEGQTYLYPVYVLTGHGTMPDGTTEWFEVIVDAQA